MATQYFPPVTDRGQAIYKQSITSVQSQTSEVIAQ
jgi:hypothetical protein